MANHRLVVPIEGMDRKVWESDYVQFPRLLSLFAGGHIGYFMRTPFWKNAEISSKEIEAIMLHGHDKWRKITDSYRLMDSRKPGKKRVKRKVVKFS